MSHRLPASSNPIFRHATRSSSVRSCCRKKSGPARTMLCLTCPRMDALPEPTDERGPASVDPMEHESPISVRRRSTLVEALSGAHGRGTRMDSEQFRKMATTRSLSIAAARLFYADMKGRRTVGRTTDQLSGFRVTCTRRTSALWPATGVRLRRKRLRVRPTTSPGTSSGWSPAPSRWTKAISDANIASLIETA